MANLYEQYGLDFNKIEQLLIAHNELKVKYHQSIEKNAELEQKLSNLHNDYQRLKLAKAFGQSEGDKKEADRRLFSLIKEIDNCLKLLNELLDE
jgi:GTP1/Obg family GTP-binding protein